MALLGAALRQARPARVALAGQLLALPVLHTVDAPQGPQGSRRHFQALVVLDFAAVSPHGHIRSDVLQPPVAAAPAAVTAQLGEVDEALGEGKFEFAVAVSAGEPEGDSDRRSVGLDDLAHGDLLGGLERQSLRQVEGGEQALVGAVEFGLAVRTGHLDLIHGLPDEEDLVDEGVEVALLQVEFAELLFGTLHDDAGLEGVGLGEDGGDFALALAQAYAGAGVLVDAFVLGVAEGDILGAVPPGVINRFMDELVVAPEVGEGSVGGPGDGGLFLVALEALLLGVAHKQRTDAHLEYKMLFIKNISAI